MKALLVTERWANAGEIQSHLTQTLNKKVILSPPGLFGVLVSQGNINQVIFDDQIPKDEIQKIMHNHVNLKVETIALDKGETNAE